MKVSLDYFEHFVGATTHKLARLTIFFIGATLGNALSLFLALPMPLLAGMGFAAVFAGAANTPLASTFMAFELFGHQAGVYAGIACIVSYIFSGHAGIYGSQRIGLSKYSSMAMEEEMSLANLPQARAAPTIDLHNDLHFWGFLKGEEELLMDNLAALRLYFHYGARRAKKHFWHNLTAPSLLTYLATSAKDFGIEQVVVHRVSAGYLKGEPISYDQGEIPDHRLPQCLELVDKEDKLRRFVDEHHPELKEVRVVLLRCEELLY